MTEEEKPEPQENDPLFLAIEEVKIVLKKHDLLGWICLIKNNHGKYYGKNIFCLESTWSPLEKNEKDSLFRLKKLSNQPEMIRIKNFLSLFEIFEEMIKRFTKSFKSRFFPALKEVKESLEKKGTN